MKGGRDRGVMVKLGALVVRLLVDFVWCLSFGLEGLMDVYVEEHCFRSCLVTYGGVDAGSRRFSSRFGNQGRVSAMSTDRCLRLTVWTRVCRNGPLYCIVSSTWDRHSLRGRVR